MAFSGLVYEDDAVCHHSLASVAHPQYICWCKASIKSCQADWLTCQASTLQQPLEKRCLQQDRSKYSERLGKWKLDDINKFMDLLDVPRGSGDKADTCAHARVAFMIESGLNCMWKLNDINTSSNQSMDLLNGTCCNDDVAHACKSLHATTACQDSAAALWLFYIAKHFAECSNPAVTAGKAALRKELLPQMVLTQCNTCMLSF